MQVTDFARHYLIGTALPVTALDPENTKGYTVFFSTTGTQITTVSQIALVPADTFTESHLLDDGVLPSGAQCSSTATLFQVSDGYIETKQSKGRLWGRLDSGWWSPILKDSTAPQLGKFRHSTGVESAEGLSVHTSGCFFFGKKDTQEYNIVKKLQNDKTFHQACLDSAGNQSDNEEDDADSLNLLSADMNIQNN